MTKLERRGWKPGKSPIEAALQLMCVFLPHVVVLSLDKHLGYKGRIACLRTKSGESAFARDASR